MTDVPSAPDEGTDRLSKGARTRQRLLSIAMERFGEQGYRRTSVSEISRAAGLTQAAAYAYFPNKEALFDAAVDADATQAIHAAWSRAEELPANQLPPLLLVYLANELDQHPLLRRVLQGQEPDALPRLINLPALSELTEGLADKVRTAQAAGDARTDIDPVVFADGTEAILLSLLMSVTQLGASTQARRQIGVITIFDTVLRPADR